MNKTLLVNKSKLVGEVSLSGAKNSALRLLAASILTEEVIALDNFPVTLLDAQVHFEMLEALGKRCEVDAVSSAVTISESRPLDQCLNWEGRSIRNTLLILGALTARFGCGKVPVPGGCQLGDRKHDLHVLVLETLGAKVTDEGDGWLSAETEDGLVGADIHLPIRSTGATENAILCGSLAKGTTRIWNPHIRPEILDLIAFLRTLGATIEVRGQESIIVHGCEGLSGGRHSVIADNVEALTWMIGSIITGGEIEIIGFPYEDLEIPLIHLRESGARFYRYEDRMIVKGGVTYPIEVSTGPYPAINSDMQPLMAVFGAMSKGETRIVDLRFPGRYGYAGELAKMGMQFSVDKNLLKIRGGTPLRGCVTQALDLRAGAALFLAGLTADEPTTIEDAWQIERGYDRFYEKAQALGCRVRLE